MKPITPERLIHALDSVTARRNKLIEKPRKLMQIAGTRGLRIHCLEATGHSERPDANDQMGLELDFEELPKNPFEMLKMQDDFFRLVDVYGSWHDHIYRIQEKAQVSGLVRGKVELGEKHVDCWVDSDRLKVLPSDLPKLKASVPAIVELWNGQVPDGFKLYRCIEDAKGCPWVPASPVEVGMQAAISDWAKVYDWDSNTEQWEIHLVLGRGTSLDSRGCSEDFCATNDKRGPSW